MRMEITVIQSHPLRPGLDALGNLAILGVGVYYTLGSAPLPGVWLSGEEQ